MRSTPASDVYLNVCRSVEYLCRKRTLEIEGSCRGTRVRACSRLRGAEVEALGVRELGEPGPDLFGRTSEELEDL